MSVVGPDFDKLKRFNLEELHQTSQAKDVVSPGPIKITEDV
jgi:tRNA acetyltransferase TAN1